MFVITLIVSFITFLTFIDKSFITLNETNLNFLLLINIGLLVFFFIVIFIEIKNSFKNNINIYKCPICRTNFDKDLINLFL